VVTASRADLRGSPATGGPHIGKVTVRANGRPSGAGAARPAPEPALSTGRDRAWCESAGVDRQQGLMFDLRAHTPIR
jgi:hypothetical protein